MKRVLLATLGSLGDLHPLIAIGLELRRRGHVVRFCTSETYRNKIAQLGFGFDVLRPDAAPQNESIAELVREIMDPKRGVERLLCGFVLSSLRDTYEDLRRAISGPPPADLLVCGELIYPAPLLAEQLKLPWATYIASPMSFFSAYDPPVLPPVPRLSKLLRWLGPAVNRAAFRLVKFVTRRWSEPIWRLRADLGLPSVADPIYEGKFSPHLVLAGFSPALAQPQPDWPPNTIATGFPFYDGEKEAASSQLSEFVKGGEPPIVFTLGSAAVLNPGNYYHESARAARLLNRRAVLLVGPNGPPPELPKDIAAFNYVPFSELFPYAAAIVHQGGIGTTGQALRAGRPMLVMPFNFDQPDNAARIVRLGVGRSLSPAQFTAEKAAGELRLLLSNPEYGHKAEQLGAAVSREEGAEVAASALERLLI